MLVLMKHHSLHGSLLTREIKHHCAKNTGLVQMAGIGSLRTSAFELMYKVSTAQQGQEKNFDVVKVIVLLTRNAGLWLSLQCALELLSCGFAVKPLEDL